MYPAWPWIHRNGPAFVFSVLCQHGWALLVLVLNSAPQAGLESYDGSLWLTLLCYPCGLGISCLCLPCAEAACGTAWSTLIPSQFLRNQKHCFWQLWGSSYRALCKIGKYCTTVCRVASWHTRKESRRSESSRRRGMSEGQRRFWSFWASGFLHAILSLYLHSLKNIILKTDNLIWMRTVVLEEHRLWCVPAQTGFILILGLKSPVLKIAKFCTLLFF